nr:helix-turn-helix domain-containing protein [Pseudenhygromyxa sp. WMMC2535]
MTTASFPTARQYDAWREAVCATHEAWDMPSQRVAAFHGTVRSRSVGATELIVCESDPCSGRRGAAELSASAREMTGLLFILEGSEQLSHPEGDTFLRAGQFTSWESTRPLAFCVPGRLRKLTWMLPSELVSPILRPYERYLHHTFDARGGCGALLLNQLQAMVELPGELGPLGEQAAVHSGLELLAAAIAGELGNPSREAERLVARAEDYIARRLEDPALCVELVASALGVTRRRLERAFAAAGHSVSRKIWSDRLERCRRDMLLEPESSLSEIAFRWGFSDAAHFSRAFRAAFGAAPSRYRAERLDASDESLRCRVAARCQT